MNNATLKKTFRYGAMVIPRAEGDLSFSAKVGDDYEENPESFTVWPNPDHGIDLLRDSVAPIHDGYEAKDHDGKEYFLRPLTKEQEIKF